MVTHPPASAGDVRDRGPIPESGGSPGTTITITRSPIIVAFYHFFSEIQFSFSSEAQSCPTLCDPMNRCTPGLPVHHQLPEPTRTHAHRVGSNIQPSHLCRPLHLLPSIFPSIRDFSNESALRMSWPKFWSFSFTISPSNEHPGLISFRMD